MERKEFYQSKIWKTVRKNIWIKQKCLCARCFKPVFVNGISDASIPKEKRTKRIVHHKIYLNNINYKNEEISLNEENLEGLCINCHNTEHFKTSSLRCDVCFDANGNLIQR